MHIGTIPIPVGAGLAPMAGVTDAAFRVLCSRQGAAWTVSEMLSAKGWICSQGKNRNALDLLVRMPGEVPGGLQLFGRDPACVAEAALQLQDKGFSFIDLNFGCPAPKITGNGEGSAMLREPKQISAVVRAVADAVQLPVTVKLRSGWDDTCINAPYIAALCEQAGAQAIAVHARTRALQYGGRADRRVIRAVRRCVSVPVIGNGDIRSGEDALSMLDETGCSAVMVGRGAEGNPWIFAQIRAALLGTPWQPPTPRDRLDMALEHLSLETELHGEHRAIPEMRKHIAWYIAGIPGAARFRTTLNRLNTRAQVEEALTEFALRTEEI